MCSAIRELFVTILIFCHPEKPRQLFDLLYRDTWNDFMHTLPEDNHNKELLKAMVLQDVEQRL